MNSIKILIAVFIAWFACSSYYNNQLTTYKNEQLQAVNQQLIRVRTEERRQRKRADEASKNLQKAMSDVDALYKRITSVSLRQSINNNTDSMPGAPANPVRAPSRSACECAKQNRDKLQRLYEQQLIIARDCDITATKNNELIRLVHQKGAFQVLPEQ